MRGMHGPRTPRIGPAAGRLRSSSATVGPAPLSFRVSRANAEQRPVAPVNFRTSVGPGEEEVFRTNGSKLPGSVSCRQCPGPRTKGGSPLGLDESGDQLENRNPSQEVRLGPPGSEGGRSCRWARVCSASALCNALKRAVSSALCNALKMVVEVSIQIRTIYPVRVRDSA
jgi:hypothetical protein